MATIADMLGNQAQVKLRQVAQKVQAEKVAPIHYVACGLPGSPYRRDSQGRLRRQGKYAPVPAGIVREDHSREDWAAYADACLSHDDVLGPVVLARLR